MSFIVVPRTRLKRRVRIAASIVSVHRYFTFDWKLPPKVVLYAVLLDEGGVMGSLRTWFWMSALAFLVFGAILLYPFRAFLKALKGDSK